MAHDVTDSWIQPLFPHPTELRIDFLQALGLVVFSDQHVSTREVDVALQRNHDTLRRKGALNSVSANENFLDPGLHAARKRYHFVAHLEHP